MKRMPGIKKTNSFQERLDALADDFSQTDFCAQPDPEMALCASKSGKSLNDTANEIRREIDACRAWQKKFEQLKSDLSIVPPASSEFVVRNHLFSTSQEESFQFDETCEVAQADECQHVSTSDAMHSTHPFVVQANWDVLQAKAVEVQSHLVYLKSMLNFTYELARQSGEYVDKIGETAKKSYRSYQKHIKQMHASRCQETSTNPFLLGLETPDRLPASYQRDPCLVNIEKKRRYPIDAEILARMQNDSGLKRRSACLSSDQQIERSTPIKSQVESPTFQCTLFPVRVDQSFDSSARGPIMKMPNIPPKLPHLDDDFG